MHWLVERTCNRLLCYCYHLSIYYIYLKRELFFIYSAWEQFRDLIPENERECFITAYHKRLNSENLETQVSFFLWYFCFIVCWTHSSRKLIAHRHTMDMCVGVVHEQVYELFLMEPDSVLNFELFKCLLFPQNWSGLIMFCLHAHLILIPKVI